MLNIHWTQDKQNAFCFVGFQFRRAVDDSVDRFSLSEYVLWAVFEMLSGRHVNENVFDICSLFMYSITCVILANLNTYQMTKALLGDIKELWSLHAITSSRLKTVCNFPKVNDDDQVYINEKHSLTHMPFIFWVKSEYSFPEKVRI